MRDLHGTRATYRRETDEGLALIFDTLETINRLQHDREQRAMDKLKKNRKDGGQQTRDVPVQEYMQATGQTAKPYPGTVHVQKRNPE